jgi:uncharacterized protein (TIGR02145 family)
MKCRFESQLILLIAILLPEAIIINGCVISGNSPAAVTESATCTGYTKATLKGKVNPYNEVTTVTFEYGTTGFLGQSIKATPHIIGGETYLDVRADITGLTDGTLYHFRVKALNINGISLGEEMTFIVSAGNDIEFNRDFLYGSVSDIDGNTYKTIQIGTQVWMAENLKTTKYRGGKRIPLVEDNAEWSKLSTPAYSWYYNDPYMFGYKAIYGALYNWFTVNSGEICPAGWHVPSEVEWMELCSGLGNMAAGGKLKEKGTKHWNRPNAEATNESGFTALPGGARGSSGDFFEIGQTGNWWCNPAGSPNGNWHWVLSFNSQYAYSSVYPDQYGYSVRCVKDK